MHAPTVAPWPFGSLQPRAYGVVLIDPPLHYKTRTPAGQAKGPARHYRILTIAEIKDLPVRELAARDCALVLWATQAQLDTAIDFIRAWGFRVWTAGAWAKQSKTGRKWAFGTGHILRSAAEFYLFGARGHPRVAVRDVRNLVIAPVREHSRKPDQLYLDLERMFPHARRCELFAREQRPGWESWGDETTKFSEGADHGDP
jgi:N6-adenosine-specific RNA methylase IME4